MARTGQLDGSEPRKVSTNGFICAVLNAVPPELATGNLKDFVLNGSARPRQFFSQRCVWGVKLRNGLAFFGNEDQSFADHGWI